MINSTPLIPRKILVADDEETILSAMEQYLTFCRYKVFCAKNGHEALKIFKRERPPLVITDLKMPGPSGEELIQALRSLNGDVQIIMITGYASVESAVETLKAGAFDYIIKPFKLEYLKHTIDKARDFLSMLISNRLLQENSMHVLDAMVKTLEQKDYYTAGHSRRVTSWSLAMAEEMGFTTEQLKIIQLGGQIHDLGKIGIDDTILRKPAKLTDDEYEKIKSHPARGVEIIKPLEFLKGTIPLIMHHHERFDGKGYPSGLEGQSIPKEARILAVADTFDAMTSSRAYRQALSAETAILELERCRKTQFDPETVDAFMEVYKHSAQDGNELEPPKKAKITRRKKQ